MCLEGLGCLAGFTGHRAGPELLLLLLLLLNDKSCLTLWPHGVQHAKLLCPSLSPRVCSNSYPLSWWCSWPSLYSAPFSSLADGTLQVGPFLIHPECSSCPPSYWSPTDSHQIHSALDSHFSGSPPLQPQGCHPNSNGLPSLAFWWQRPCLQCPTDPKTYFPLPAPAVSVSWQLRAYCHMIRGGTFRISELCWTQRDGEP